MPAYLGKPGALLAFMSDPTKVSEDRPASYRRTVGGRVKMQRSSRSRRTWAVGVSTASPQELSALLSLLGGSAPPWCWVDAFAQVTNLLTPGQSLLRVGSWSGSGFVEGGSVLTPDGNYSPISLLNASGGSVSFGKREGAADYTAVIPGKMIIGSVYVKGTGNLNILFQDFTGADIASTSSPYDTTTTLARKWVRAIPPAGAVTARLAASGASQVAMPALTWTPELADWSIGRGCNRAAVEGLEEAVQIAVVDLPYLRRSGISFTIREVG